MVYVLEGGTFTFLKGQKKYPPDSFYLGVGETLKGKDGMIVCGNEVDAKYYSGKAKVSLTPFLSLIIYSTVEGDFGLRRNRILLRCATQNSASPLSFKVSPHSAEMCSFFPYCGYGGNFLRP